MIEKFEENLNCMQKILSQRIIIHLSLIKSLVEKALAYKLPI